MCTALSFKNNGHYFGRNLDLDYSYEEQITICPRNFTFSFRNGKTLTQHFALIGMAYTVENYPLFYDATNEYGLSMAGLNFPQNAVYFPKKENATNVCPFEFIPYILTQCKTVEEAKLQCQSINLINENFRDHLPNSPLHWIIADEHESVTVESTEHGLQVYPNPVGALTNNPTFDIQLFNLNNYKHLSPKDSVNNFSQNLNFDSYSLGLGGLGLPGDLSSMSRFVRVVFNKFNSACESDSQSEINHFFHLLESVYQNQGATFVAHSGKYEYTIYTSCVDTKNGVYYYKTYNNTTINGVGMHNVNLNTTTLYHYPLILNNGICIQN